MTKEEKLQAIRAKCVELLAIAEKRTPGEWDNSLYHFPNRFVVVRTGNADNDAFPGKRAVCKVNHGESKDARFISSCAGPAEAGWQTTIDIIDAMEQLHENTQEHLARPILTAWQPIMNFPTTERPR
jgi:hypothetical protein